MRVEILCTILKVQKVQYDRSNTPMCKVWVKDLEADEYFKFHDLEICFYGLQETMAAKDLKRFEGADTQLEIECVLYGVPSGGDKLYTNLRFQNWNYHVKTAYELEMEEQKEWEREHPGQVRVLAELEAKIQEESRIQEEESKVSTESEIQTSKIAYKREEEQA